MALTKPTIGSMALNTELTLPKKAYGRRQKIISISTNYRRMFVQNTS